MVVKDNSFTVFEAKRPRLGNLNLRDSNRVVGILDSSPPNRANSDDIRHSSHSDERGSNNFDIVSDQWSELFDSFKDTSHLKDLHCR